MASPGPPMNGTVTPVGAPLGAGTNAYQIWRVRPCGFAQLAGTVAKPHVVVASKGAGQASVVRAIGCLSIRSALLGVAVRQLGVAWNGAGHDSCLDVPGCLSGRGSAAPLDANAARNVVARTSAISGRRPRCRLMARSPRLGEGSTRSSS
jgi:hypothetical protein